MQVFCIVCPPANGVCVFVISGWWVHDVRRILSHAINTGRDEGSVIKRLGPSGRGPFVASPHQRRHFPSTQGTLSHLRLNPSSRIGVWNSKELSFYRKKKKVLEWKMATSSSVGRLPDPAQMILSAVPVWGDSITSPETPLVDWRAWKTGSADKPNFLCPSRDRYFPRNVVDFFDEMRRKKNPDSLCKAADARTMAECHKWHQPSKSFLFRSSALLFLTFFFFFFSSLSLSWRLSSFFLIVLHKPEVFFFSHPFSMDSIPTILSFPATTLTKVS